MRYFAVNVNGEKCLVSRRCLKRISRDLTWCNWMSDMHLITGDPPPHELRFSWDFL